MQHLIRPLLAAIVILTLAAAAAAQTIPAEQPAEQTAAAPASAAAQALSEAPPTAEQIMRQLEALKIQLDSMTPDDAKVSSYSITFGGGYSRWAEPNAQAWGSFTYCQAEWCPYLAWTNLGGPEATVAGGARRNLARQGPLTLFLLGDLGAATSESGALGMALGGGGGIDYDLGVLTNRLQNFSLTALVKADKATTTTVHPTFGFGLTYTFWK